MWFSQKVLFVGVRLVHQQVIFVGLRVGHQLQLQPGAGGQLG